MHAHCEILALHDGRANSGWIGVTDDWDSLRRNYFGGRIPALSLGRGAVDLDELREVRAVVVSIADGYAAKPSALNWNGWGAVAWRKPSINTFVVAWSRFPSAKFKINLLFLSIATKQ